MISEQIQASAKNVSGSLEPNPNVKGTVLLNVQGEHFPKVLAPWDSWDTSRENITFILKKEISLNLNTFCFERNMSEITKHRTCLVQRTCCARNPQQK